MCDVSAAESACVARRAPTAALGDVHCPLDTVRPPHLPSVCQLPREHGSHRAFGPVGQGNCQSLLFADARGPGRSRDAYVTVTEVTSREPQLLRV